MDNSQLLVSKYLDGELADDEIAQLATLLRADAGALDQFVFGSFVHSHLNEWMDQERVQDDAMRGVSAAGKTATRMEFSAATLSLEQLLCDCPELADEPEVAARRQYLWPRSVAARAAMLLVAASAAFAAYLYATQPVIVAQLTQATNCQWDADQVNTRVGTLLESGQELRLVKGRALITLVSGAQVLLEAPSSVRLDAVSGIHLKQGRIAVKVPTPAIGFTVSTSLAQFVDLGTAFTLELEANESFELYVFEGLVELQLDKRFGEAAHQPLRVAEVRAVRFEVGSADIAPLPFNQGEQMPF